VNTDVLVEPIAALRRSTGLISENLSYIQKELPQLHAPENLRDEVATACRNFEAAIWDVNSEIRNLEEKLGMCPGEPETLNPDPGVTIGLIDGWMRAEIVTLHQLVTKLRDLESEDANMQGLEILVTESGANILHAYKDLRDNLDLITAHLR
jgi:hypothetical protein